MAIGVPYYPNLATLVNLSGDMLRAVATSITGRTQGEEQQKGEKKSIQGS